MMRYVLVCLVMLGVAGIAGAQDLRSYKNPCGELTVVTAEKGGFVYDIERTLREMKARGEWSGSTILTDAVAKRLPAGYYYVNGSDEMVYFEPEVLGVYGAKSAWEYYSGKKTTFNRAKCGEVPKLVTITAEIRKKEAELNLSKSDSFWERDGDDLVVEYPEAGKEIRYNTTTGTLCVLDVVKSEETTCRDSVEWRGKYYYKSGLLSDTVFIDSSSKVVYIHDLNIVPVKDSIVKIMMNEGDSVWVGDRKVTEPGVYPFVIHGFCDTTVQYLVSQNGCEPCIDEHRRWLEMGYVAVGAFARYEILPSNWQRKVLYGGEIIGEYKFINGLLFKNPCWGESIRLRLAISSVNNPYPKPGGCIECHNVDEADKRMLNIDAKYYITWLKGFPYIVSVGLGPVMRYHRIEGYKSTMFGAGATIEGEWFFWERFSLFLNGGVDYFPTTHKFVPNTNVGIRLWTIKGRTEKRA